MWMPWSHRLPDHVSVASEYGQNLVQLAVALADAGPGPLRVIDVGANIGDSALQIAARVPAQILAVEADEFYLGYLRRNVSALSTVTIAPVLLTATESPTESWEPVRVGGTAHFREVSEDGGGSTGLATLPVSRLRDTHPAFDHVRLIKSDTDGYDALLVPALARAYTDSRPVLFFEYDPALTASVSGAGWDDAWKCLAELGYDYVGMWSNTGAPLELSNCDDAVEVARRWIDGAHGRVPYLDIVAVHHQDVAGKAAVTALFAD